MIEDIEKDLSYAEKRKIKNSVLEDLLFMVDPDEQIINHPTVSTVLDYLAVVCEFETKKTERNSWYRFSHFQCEKRQVERFLYVLLENSRFEGDRLAQEIRDNIANKFSQNALYHSVFSAIVEFALEKYVDSFREKEEPITHSEAPTLAAIPF